MGKNQVHLGLAEWRVVLPVASLSALTFSRRNWKEVVQQQAEEPRSPRLAAVWAPAQCAPRAPRGRCRAPSHRSRVPERPGSTQATSSLLAGWAPGGALKRGGGALSSRDRPGGAFTPLHLSIPIAPAVAAPGPPPLEAGVDRPRRRHPRRLGVPAPGPSCGRHEAAGPASEADLAARDGPSGADAGAATRAPERGPAAHLGVQVRERRGRARRVGEERRLARARPGLSREAGRRAGRRGARGPGL